MDNQLLKRFADVMDDILPHCPKIKSHIPDNIKPFDSGFEGGTGACTDPGLIDVKWFHPYGYREFAASELPEGYHCFGIKNRCASENLFIMWFKDGRKFWFYDQIAVLVGKELLASPERTGDRLNLALERWEESSYDVLYSGFDDSFHMFCYGY